MDRKWRTNRGALDVVMSFDAFTASLGAWRAGYDLASPTDLYATYTVLLIESKDWEVRWSEAGEFYYFVTRQTVTPEGAEPAAVAPEGDEDPPELVAQGSGDCSPGRAPAPSPPAAAAAAPPPAGDAPAAAAAAEQEPPVPVIRTQILVPISSACARITPRLLQRLFSIRGIQAQALLLGLVDSHGVVTRSSLYNYIQAPLEGPGTANLELIDD